MARMITVEEAIERAQRAQENRVETVREIAETRSALTHARRTAEQELAALKAEHDQRIAALERRDVAAYTAAKASGWSSSELSKIGFSAPATPPKQRRRASKKEGQVDSHE